MLLRKCLLFAMLSTIVGLVAYGGVHARQARLDVAKPNTRLPAPMPAASASRWYGSEAGNKPGGWSGTLRRQAELLPASFVPIQFKDPRDLGAGKLLVASRSLRDPNFAQTVVLLVKYDERGALGLILNRRTNVPLSQVLDLQAAKNRSAPIYLGGPVDPSAVFGLYQSPVKINNAENIFSGLYLISDKDLFEKVLSSRPAPNVFHVYLGYAGWAPGQLQAEVESGAWYVFPAETAAVFNSDPNSLWSKMIEETQWRQAQLEPFAESSSPTVVF